MNSLIPLQSTHLLPQQLYVAGLTKSSRRVVIARLKSLALTLGLKDWLQLDFSQVDRTWLLLLREMNQHLSPSSLNAIYSAVKGCTKTAWEMGVCSQTQYQIVMNTKSVKGERVRHTSYVDVEVVKRLLSQCSNLRDKAMVALMYGCGLRRSEIVHLQWKNMNTLDGSILVQGKGNKERMVWMPEFVQEIMNDLSEEKTHDYCFISVQYKSPLTDQAVYYILKDLQNKVGVDEEFSPHSLRASFASRLLENGNDLLTVAGLLGHSDVKTVKNYDRRGDKQKQLAIKGITL